MATPPVSAESQVFSEHQQNLHELLTTSLVDVASRAAAKRLITNDVKGKALDGFDKAVTSNTRALCLVDVIMTKTKRNPSVIEAFTESLDESGLHELCKFLKKAQEKAKADKVGNPAYEVLDIHQMTIAENLLHNITPVAGWLLQHQAITSKEHSLFTDSSAKHSDLVTGTILSAIGTEIKKDSKNFDIFLDDVLDDIGGPASKLAEVMKSKRDCVKIKQDAAKVKREKPDGVEQSSNTII